MSNASHTSPYRTLNLRRDATADQIRRAYRKLAMKHHPDRGGDRAKFELVHAAYELLNDADRRARYDTTGDTSVPRFVPPAIDVMNVLSPALGQVVEQLITQGAKPESVDLVAQLKDGLGNGVKALSERKKNLEKMKAFFGDSVKRFTVTDGEENLLASAAKSHLANAEAQLNAIGSEIDRIKRALEYLKKYGYTFEKALRASGVWGAGTASTNFTWRVG